MIDHPDIQLWIENSKTQKMAWVEATDRGDLHPTVIAIKNNTQLAVVVAPQLNKEQGLEAALILRKSLGADNIILLLDAHCAKGERGTNPEEFAKKFPPGSMQKMCDEEGACEKGLITDCLICVQCGEDGKVTMVNIPYSYHGKGTTFTWMDDRITVISEKPEFAKKDQGVITGFIPGNVKKIMATETLSNMVSQLGNMMQLDRTRQLYHMCRATFRILKEKGFLVHEDILEELDRVMNPVFSQN